MDKLKEINILVQQGRAAKVIEAVKTAIDDGYSPELILEESLIKAMNTVGEKFKNNEVFVPEVLIAARAMNSAINTLNPYLKTDNNKSEVTVVIGTVKGDLHNIGANIVKLMFEGNGFKVIDLGVDVAAETFIDAAIEYDAKIICCSALLTTTMSELKKVINEAKNKGIRDKVKIFIGGAPVTQGLCDSIGADYYAFDAGTAAEIACNLLKK